jgi:drug/metabolite transporter (DMT)-like permease
MHNSGYIAFALLGLIWGSNFVFMKWATQLISPGQVVFLRVLFGFLPILVFALLRGDLRKEHLRRGHHYLVMSLLATSIYYYAFAKGTSLLLSGVAGMLSGSIPLFSFLTALLLLREERITARKAVGVVLGFLGVVLIARPWAAGIESINVEGTLYMVLGSLSVGCSFVYARKFLSHQAIPAAALTTYQIDGALAVLCLTTDFTGITRIGEEPKALLGMILGLGLAGTGIAYILYYHIVERLGAVSASSVTYIPPVVALFIGFFLAQEPIGPWDVTAMAAILAGVFLLRAK